MFALYSLFVIVKIKLKDLLLPETFSNEEINALFIVSFFFLQNHVCFLQRKPFAILEWSRYCYNSENVKF